MEESGEIDKAFPTNYDDDKKFCLIFYKAMKRLLDIESMQNVSYLYRYFKIFNEYYTCWCDARTLNLKDPDNIIKELLEDSLYFRIAFVYKNATLLSSAVAFHFRNVYKKAPNVVERLITKKQVKICSFGGSSAADIVALVTVLESIARENGNGLDFRVTIIDLDERWKNILIIVISCLEQFHEATWKISFIHDDLSQKKAWMPETCRAVQQADVLTLVRFKSNWVHKKTIVKTIHDMSQDQAVLFILDHPGIQMMNLTVDMTGFCHFHLIHAELCDNHPLDVEAVKLLEALYHKQFGDEKYFRSNISFNVFASVWIKLPQESDTNLKNNLECIFQNNEEKFNPKRSLLSTNAFTKWENMFIKEKEAMGWKEKGIKRVVLTEKEKRSRLLSELIPLKKGLELIEKTFLSKFEASEFGETESVDTFKELLVEYETQKKQYSLMKQNAYFSSLHYNN